MRLLFEEGSWHLREALIWKDEKPVAYVAHDCTVHADLLSFTYFSQTDECPACKETIPESIKTLAILYNDDSRHLIGFTRLQP